MCVCMARMCAGLLPGQHAAAAGTVMLVGTALGIASAPAGASYSKDIAGWHAGLSSPAYAAHTMPAESAVGLCLGVVAALRCAFHRQEQHAATC